MLLLLLLCDDDPKPRSWVHDINLQREIYGEYHRLVPELRKDEKRFHIYFRMNTAQFDHLEMLLKPVLRKDYTNLRTPISVGERLALRYLATGDAFTTIAFNYRMGMGL